MFSVFSLLIPLSCKFTEFTSCIQFGLVMLLEGLGTPNIETSSGESSHPASTANPALAQQVFHLFKDYLSTQLDGKEKKMKLNRRLTKKRSS